MNIVQKPTQRVLPQRSLPIQAIVLHTTGDTDLNKILAYYDSPGGLQPHYVIGLDGATYQTVAEDRIAWHCAIEPSEANTYSHGYKTWSRYKWTINGPVDCGQELTNYRQWRDEWQPKSLQSPLDLVTGSHPNSVSIGIEMQQPEKPGPQIFTDAQYSSCAQLVSDICNRYTIAVDRDHILQHYDCSPMRRSNSSGSWDPGVNFSFAYLWDNFVCGFPNKLK